MSKTKKFLVCVVLLCFIFVSTADALLWFLAGVIRAGVVAVSTFVSTPMGQAVVRSAVNHAIVGGAAYWYFNRGDSVPPAEKYIQVTLTDTKAEVQAMKNEGKIFSSGFATSIPFKGYITLWDGVNPGKYEIRTNPSGSLFCLPCPENYPDLTHTCFGSGGFYSYSCYESTWDWRASALTYGGVCTAAQKAVYPSDPATLTVETEKIFTNSDLKTRIQAALGRDIQRGGALVEAPVPGEPITVVGENGTSKEWPSGYSEQDVAAWLGNTPTAFDTAPASVTATDIGTAVGTAVNTNLTNIKTSVDGVKTSADGVKASVDAVNAKLGTNPGNLSSPSYDNSYTNPTENSIGDRIGSFISSNPIIGAINGSHLSLSGAVCSATVGASFGKPLTLNFCWMESYLILFGNVMVIFAGLTAAFIIFRRGD